MTSLSPHGAAPPLVVLVVDDEPDIVETLGFALSMRGLKPLGATGALEAQEILEQGGVDVVLTDLRMPGRSGAQLIEWIMLRVTPPVVFVMTGFSDDATADIVRRGADGIFAKPFDLDTLTETIMAAATSRRARLERALG